VGPFDEGDTVSLVCSSSGGRPLPEVKWFEGNHHLKSKISVAENPDASGSTVTSTANFIVSRKNLESTFTCSVSSNATTMPLLRSVSFDVRGKSEVSCFYLYSHLTLITVKPLSLKIQGPLSPVMSGEQLTISCSVEGARPPASISWYNRSELVNPQPEHKEELTEDGTFR